MNLLNITEEELVEDMNAKIIVRDNAHREVLDAADRIHERRRLVALQSQFGQISEEDIKQELQRYIYYTFLTICMYIF